MGLKRHGTLLRVLLLLAAKHGVARTTHYSDGDEVPLYANKVRRASASLLARRRRLHGIGERMPKLAPQRQSLRLPADPQVGPYVNPSETYNYYDLPFCQHGSMEVPKQSLGETLKGDELTRSLFDVRFKSALFACHPPPPKSLSP